MFQMKRINLAACALGVLPFTAFANGTTLDVLSAEVTAVCSPDGGSATVSVPYTVTSTGSADSAAVTLSIDGGVPITLAEIASGNIEDGGGWTFDKNTRTATGTYTLVLANGEYSFEVCAAQSGSGGREPKQACGDSKSIVVNCVVPEVGCSGEVFGRLTTTNLCKSDGNVTTQFRGDFGPTAILSITSDTGFSFSPNVDRSGDSCNYTYNWAARDGNGGPGTYTFTLSGNGNSTTAVAYLTCDAPKGKR